MHNPLPPAQLWLGSPNFTELEALKYLQEQLCAHGGCSVCSTCTQLFDKQHHALLWLMPEKQYTLESLEPIKTACAYALEDQEHFFFVLPKAELLSVACQNSLLKTIEEPPHGYHFILLALGKDFILPTIQSRCIIKQFKQDQGSTHPLYNFFATSNQTDPSVLLKILEEHKPSEQESIGLINQLLAFWVTTYKRCAHEPTSQRYKQAERIITILNDGIMNPPMPGSSALFWKNVFIQLQTQ